MSTAHHSITRALRTTPLRDLLRGRITRRLDWRYPIAQADLPEPIPALIGRVVRRTRLFRDEKADVAQELVAHFTDAIREGAAADAAAKSFGDPRTAARLISRSKKRSRPPFRKAVMRTLKVFTILILVVLAVYTFEFVRFNSAKPNIARNYTAEYNAQIDAIPMDQRAWPIYKQAIMALHPLTDEEQASIGVAPIDPEWDTQVALIESRSDALDLFRQASARQHMGFSWSDVLDAEMYAEMYPRDEEYVQGMASDNPMLIQILLPHLGDLRRAARLLVADSLIAADTGDAARAFENISACIAMASHKAPTKTLIEELVELSTFTLAADTAAEMLWSHPDLLSDDQLVRLAHSFAVYREGNITLSLDGERLMWDDIIQRIYSDNGKGDGHLTAEGIRMLTSLQESDVPPVDVFSGLDATSFAGPVASHLIAGREEMSETYDRYMSRAVEHGRRPLCEQLSDDEISEHAMFFEQGTIHQMRYFPIYTLMPAISRAMRTGHRAELSRDAIVTLIALERFKRTAGTYPAFLNDLVPQFLPAVPDDIFDCQPLRYAIRDGRPYIYSVGYDLTDDAGEPCRKTNGDPDPTRAGRHRTESPGDWILFPPQSYWDAQCQPEEEFEVTPR